MKNKQDHFEILRKIQKKPNSSQRELADELGFSLGKLNYCLKALKEKGVEVEYMLKTNEGHGFRNEENKFEFYSAMEQFLEKHLRPDMHSDL